MPQLYEELGLTHDEYQAIRGLQGREPTHVELAVFSLMWSEHCGYKHSRPLLKRFPTTGAQVLQGPGENAGIVDIGGGLAVAMKVESHNHPSAVEPYQGAATGVGGILRDIFTMGARPICNLDSLRFGEMAPLSAGAAAGTSAETEAGAVPPAGGGHGRQRYLFEQVVAGVGGYGNCMGIPTVGGEVYFEDAYAGNCLVNAMTVGLVAPRAHRGGARPPAWATISSSSAPAPAATASGGQVLASQTFDETLEQSVPRSRWAPLHREEAAGGLSRPAPPRTFRGAAGPGRRRHHVLLQRDGGQRGRGHRHPYRPVPLPEPGMEPWEIMISEAPRRLLQQGAD